MKAVKLGETLFLKITKNNRSKKRQQKKMFNFSVLLKELIDNNSWDKKISAVQIIEKWNEIVGLAFSQNVKPKKEDKQILFVECSSQSWKMQVKINKRSILKKIEQQYGKGIINDIKPI